MGKAREKPLVIIVGRPNTGKSTLFNRLIGRRLAIVDELPGVTRDLIAGECEWNGAHFDVIDTGGIGKESEDPLQELVAARTWETVADCDLIIFVTDARAGISEGELEFRRVLMRLGKPVILAVNKVDHITHEAAAAEFYGLGIEPTVLISAISGRRVDELCDAMKASVDWQRFPDAITVAPPKRKRRGKVREEEAAPSTEEEAQPSIVVIVMGKQNVGKSSLVNALLAEDKILVSELPGTTRDAISAAFEYEGRRFELTDTAGMQKLSRMDDVDYYSFTRADRAARMGEVCLLVLDAERGVEEMDKRVAKRIEDYGRGVVIALNKWDLFEDSEATRAAMTEHVFGELTKLTFAPLVFVSALEATGLGELMEAIVSAHANFQRKVNPQALREVIDEETTIYPPPVVKNRNLEFHAVRQARSAPPTFVFDINDEKLLRQAYRNFLENTLRRHFELAGTHIRLRFREVKRGKKTRKRKK